MATTRRAPRPAVGQAVVVAILAALAVTCGLAPQDNFTGRRIGDGVSPWEDLGALELCLANVRVGPPDTTNGGFCVDQSTPNEPTCVADDDCASRERCVCGRCTVQYCTSNGECGGGRICTFNARRCDRPCAGDASCSAGEICNGGVCKGQCNSDPDCQTGEVCSSMGRCIVADCADDGDCLGTEICKVQREPRVTTQPTVLAEAAPTETGAAYTMWLEMSDPPQLERAIWRATSVDGVRYKFDPAVPVLEDGGAAHAPSVVRAAGGGFTIYYETAAGIRSATSADGVAFGAPTTVVAGDFHAPAAATDEAGDTLVYMHSGDRQGIALWRGTGSARPVFGALSATDPILWRAVEKVGDPFVLVETSAMGSPVVRLWFDAFGTESGSSVQFGEIVAIPPNDSLGYASALLATPDEFVTWQWNPVFDRVIAFLEHRAELAPAVVQVPGEEAYFLYFTGGSSDGSEREGLGVARNPPR